MNIEVELKTEDIIIVAGDETFITVPIHFPGRPEIKISFVEVSWPTTKAAFITAVTQKVQKIKDEWIASNEVKDCLQQFDCLKFNVEVT